MGVCLLDLSYWIVRSEAVKRKSSTAVEMFMCPSTVSNSAVLSLNRIRIVYELRFGIANSPATSFLALLDSYSKAAHNDCCSAMSTMCSSCGVSRLILLRGFPQSVYETDEMWHLNDWSRSNVALLCFALLFVKAERIIRSESSESCGSR